MPLSAHEIAGGLRQAAMALHRAAVGQIPALEVRQALGPLLPAVEALGDQCLVAGLAVKLSEGSLSPSAQSLSNMSRRFGELAHWLERMPAPEVVESWSAGIDPAVLPTYASYLGLVTLLGGQHPLRIGSLPDETFFIVIHQSHELWFKVILQRLEEGLFELQEGTVEGAVRCLGKASTVMHHMAQQIGLLKILDPADFLRFRDALGKASGFQSAQFREIEFLVGIREEHYLEAFQADPRAHAALGRRFNGPSLRDGFLGRLSLLGYDTPTGDAAQTVRSLRQVYQEPGQHAEAHRLCEAVFGFDEALLSWRQHHVLAVSRIIGTRTGTGGSPGVAYLEVTIQKRAVPELWEARSL